MKKIVLSVLISFIVSLFGFNQMAFATPSASEYAVVINLAGRQRMLTQKMSKEMLLIASGVARDENRKSLQQTATLFDSTLTALKEGNSELGLPPTTGKATLKTLAKVEQLWREFQKNVDIVLAAEDVPVTDIAQQNLPLLKKMNTVVRLYEKEAKKATGQSAGVVINLAGKQRMLSQKMSKEALLIHLGYEQEDNKSQLRATASLFDRTLNGLRNGDSDLDLPATSDPDILAQLSVVDGLWREFAPLIATASAADTNHLNMAQLKQLAQLNLPLLKEMNKAVKMYEQAAQ